MVLHEVMWNSMNHWLRLYRVSQKNKHSFSVLNKTRTRGSIFDKFSLLEVASRMIRYYCIWNFLKFLFTVEVQDSYWKMTFWRSLRGWTNITFCSIASPIFSGLIILSSVTLINFQLEYRRSMGRFFRVHPIATTRERVWARWVRRSTPVST